MGSILANFPTEKIKLHKPSGDIYEVTALVQSSGIQSEDSSIPIETNDYFAPEDEREVELKLVYSQNINENDIPDDDVKITVSEISIPFMQAD